MPHGTARGPMDWLSDLESLELEMQHPGCSGERIRHLHPNQRIQGGDGPLGRTPHVLPGQEEGRL